MKGITIVERKLTVKVDLAAEDWELFTATMDCKRAAETLNRNLEKAVNSGCSREDAHNYMYYVMDKLRKYGASDTEPHCVLIEALDAIYGMEGRS